MATMVRYATRVTRSHVSPGRATAYCFGAGHPIATAASTRSHHTRSFCYTRPVTVYTVGHSTRTLEQFLALLGAHGIAGVADVRRFPASRRHPHFGREPLSRPLAAAPCHYDWLLQMVSRRPARPASPHV